MVLGDGHSIIWPKWVNRYGFKGHEAYLGSQFHYLASRIGCLSRSEVLNEL